jgi:hypothetical protein
VLCTEQANAAGTLVEGGLSFGGFCIGADFLCAAVLFRLRLNTHGFRRYTLRAYAPLCPAIASDTLGTFIIFILTYTDLSQTLF